MDFGIGDRIKTVNLKGEIAYGTIIKVFKYTCHVEWDIKTTPMTDVIKQGSITIGGRGGGLKYSKVVRKDVLEKV